MPCCDMSIGWSTRAGGHVIHLGGRHINTARMMCVVMANGTDVVVDSERGLIDYRPAHPARQGSSRRLGERHTLTPLSTLGEIPSYSLRPFPVTVLAFHTYSIITPAKPAAVSPPPALYRHILSQVAPAIRIASYSFRHTTNTHTSFSKGSRPIWRRKPPFRRHIRIPATHARLPSDLASCSAPTCRPTGSE